MMYRNKYNKHIFFSTNWLKIFSVILPRIQFHRKLFFASVISIAWFPITVRRWPVARIYVRAPGNISDTQKKKRQTAAIYKPIWCHALRRHFFISLSLFSSFTHANEMQKIKFVDTNKILCISHISVSPKLHFYNVASNKWFVFVFSSNNLYEDVSFFMIINALFIIN